jgi:DNA-binding transcriptional LysR family regulator
MSPALARRARRRTTREQLLRESPLWCVARPSSAYALTIDALRELGANLDNVNTCSRVAAIAEFVARGGGVGLLPEAVVADRLRDGRLLHVPDVEPIPVELTMACDRNQRQPVVRYIMESAMRYYAPASRAKVKPARIGRPLVAE